ncbi:type II toxin-antitoxin system prevent-host-death family antitoxin [Campylobacter corcagiensis]|uniref:Antitoxin n=1 Tax=Campylobacter corcagiensis TaxID=1448857 RepID=A0A7M1LFU3_9BACT|nr:type II toxin-antitoxin system prevent-host-death family antitoxin [Campylobacter corcagiensis]QKF64659.1 toxin-antitoxin system, antitoxin component, Phd/YefM family [Campylobacter corcagiensis]QOQ87173.1 type II toxin-antitoxin system Phd/YefM family antitoxin [Campylobacter corcagiensis]
MASFNQDEIYTATEVVRNFSSVLTKVSSGDLKKAVIVKNNKFEAVMISVKEFERLEKAVDLLNILAQKRQKDGD